MKKFIIDIIKFLVFSLVAYIIAIIAFGELAPTMFKKNLKYQEGGYGASLYRLNEIEEYSKPDLLFLGSSHTYRSFDGRIFDEYGYSSFNMGTSAQSFLQTNALLEIYGEKLHPKIVLIEVNPMTFSGDGVESSLDLIANAKLEWPIIKMAIKQNHLKVWNSLIFGLYYQTFKGKSKEVSYEHQYSDTYIHGGFLEKDLSFYKPTKLKHEQHLSIKDDQLQSFISVLKYIDAKMHAKIILVQAPITKNMYKINVDNQKFDSLMTTFDYKYINFNEQPDLNLIDSLDFYDRHHLNQNGVEKFDNYLIELFDNKGIW